MKKDNGMVIPVRLEEVLGSKLSQYHEQTGLSKSFIIRRCCEYALHQFMSGKADILTMRSKE